MEAPPFTISANAINMIAKSSRQSQSGPFIDFMLRELLNTLQMVADEKVPNKVPNKAQ